MDIRAVKFRVGREWRLGGLFRPEAGVAAPAVLMLHGFPGFLQNEDIAAELCRRGMTVFIPRFRGCWGSSGLFTLPGLLDDAQAALRLLARYPRVDGTRLGVLGYSLGGWVALRLASERRLAAAVVMAPAAPRADEPRDRTYLRQNARVVGLPGVGRAWREYLEAAREEAPERYMGLISPTPLLFLQGLQDRLVPPSSTARLWTLAGPPKRLVEFPREAHEFQADRPAVVAAACGWLESHLAGRAAAPAPSAR